MAGDITRSTFDKPRHYSGVRMQQGRVQMDADWNEQLDIRLYTDRATNRDVIGSCGAPEENAANANFAVQVQPGGNLLLKAGRIYVSGILCEAENDALIALPTPAGAIPVQPDLPGVDFTGPGFAFEPLLSGLGGGPGFDLPSSPGTYTAFLDVWEREITALEDPLIREVALGGPDTATRRKVVWQAKVRLLSSAVSGVDCPTDWDSLFPPSTGTLAARSTPDPPNTNPCAVPATAGYRRLENQLYRVEIHQGGAAGAATFKFSRDNASITAAWTGQDGANPDNLIVSTLGRDHVLGFTGGQWIEITDDTRELWGLPGTLVQIKTAQVSAQGPALTIDPATASPAGAVKLSDFPRNPKVRRWEQVATPTVTLTGGAIAVQENAWLDLEDGVQVRFDTGGAYRTGDYWLIPARTSTAITSPLVEWPVDASTTPPTPIRKRAFGIKHYYCSLALLTFNPTGGFAFLQDCRNLFPPLTDICAKDVCFDNTNCALPQAKTVQEAIDQLCRSTKGGCCTITVSPADLKGGKTLQQIVNSVAGKQATICLSPGTYTLTDPLTLVARNSNVTIEGCHPDVIIQADTRSLPKFLHGMFVAFGADRIAIRGLRFQLPAVPFPQNGGELADLPVATMISIGSLDLRELAVGIGVRALQCTNLEITDCRFDMQPPPPRLAVFEAGVFLGASCTGLQIRRNTFVHAAPITPSSSEVRFGILGASTVSGVTFQQQDPTGSIVSAAVLPARLDDAWISENSFSGLTAAVFLHAEIGLLRLEENHADNGYAGFEIMSLRFVRNDPQLGRYTDTLNDVAYAVANAFAEGYPFPPGFDPKPLGQINVTNATWVPQKGSSADSVVAAAFLLDGLYAAIEGAAFPNLVRQARSLSLTITGNQIDVSSIPVTGTVLPTGPGLVVHSEALDLSGSVIAGNNRIRNRSRIPACAIFDVIQGTATGNEIWNLSAANAGISLVIAPPSALASGGLMSAIAVTGNLLRGTPDLPPHAGAPPPLDRWEVLNQIL